MKMKLLFTMLIVTMGSLTYAQDTILGKNEISISLKPKIGIFGSQNEESLMPYYYYWEDFEDISANGIVSMDPDFGMTYKRLFGSGAMRVTVYGKYLNSSVGGHDSDNEYSETALSEAVIIPSLGYEFRKTYEKSMLYYGCDAYAGIAKYEFIMIDENINAFITYTNKETYSFNVSAYGIKPFIGFKYFISKHFSLGIEGSVRGDFRSGNVKYTDSNGVNPEVTETKKYSGVFSGVAPAGRIVAGFNW